MDSLHRRRSHSRIYLAIVTFLVFPSLSKAQNSSGNVLVGETKVTVVAGYKGNDKLPAPHQIVLHDLDVPTEIVVIDRSTAANLHSNGPIARMKGNSGQEQDPAMVAQEVRSAFSKTLLSDLDKTAIPVTAAPLGTDPDSPVGTLIIRGNFTALNQGDESKRIMIGLGRGASEAQAHVIISLLTANGPLLLSELNVDSKSGKKPGAAETMGVGSAAGSAAVSGATDNKATVEGDSSRMAHAVAKELKNIMTAQQWIPSQSSDKPTETSAPKQTQ